VTNASVDTVIIQESASFIDGQTSTKNDFNPTSIENDSDEEVSRGLMANASRIVPFPFQKYIIPKIDIFKI
jgi:hypothetical protein